MGEQSRSVSGYQFWQKRDRWFIRKCDGIVVLTLDGWVESEGVTDEIKYARSRGLDVVYLSPRAYSTTKETTKRKKKGKVSLIGGKNHAISSPNNIK